jgi:hypothetical protein
VRLCQSCQCPASPSREVCAFCGAELVAPDPVAFSLERRADGFDWVANGALVASAIESGSGWQLSDARGDHVAMLVNAEVGDEIALLSPNARYLGTIRRRDSEGSIAADSQGRAVLVLRRDGELGAHLVDRSGDVVAVASWDDADASTDLLVTPLGTRHSLAMVFGLLLSLEVSRHAGRGSRQDR